MTEASGLPSVAGGTQRAGFADTIARPPGHAQG